MYSNLKDLVRELVRDEAGQDLVEYALLTTAIGFAGIFTWSLVGNAISGTYSSWFSGVYNLADPPAPSGGGS